MQKKHFQGSFAKYVIFELPKMPPNVSVKTLVVYMVGFPPKMTCFLFAIWRLMEMHVMTISVCTSNAHVLLLFWKCVSLNWHGHSLLYFSCSPVHHGCEWCILYSWAFQSFNTSHLQSCCCHFASWEIIHNDLVPTSLQRLALSFTFTVLCTLMIAVLPFCVFCLIFFLTLPNGKLVAQIKLKIYSVLPLYLCTLRIFPTYSLHCVLYLKRWEEEVLILDPATGSV